MGIIFRKLFITVGTFAIASLFNMGLAHATVATSTITTVQVSSVESRYNQFIFVGSGTIVTSSGTNQGTFTVTVPATRSNDRNKAKTCETYLMLLMSNSSKYKVQLTLNADPQSVDNNAYDFQLGSIRDLNCTLLLQ